MSTFPIFMNAVRRDPHLMVRGRGSWLEDIEGTRYLDFVQARATNSLGHCSEIVQRALQDQAAQVINQGSMFYAAPAVELAQLLVTHSCFDKVFFANSGTEANECAIKIARKWGRVERQGAFEILTFKNAFHGRTFGSMSATGRGWENTFGPLVPGFRQAQFNDISSVVGSVGTNTSAVMIEVVQGEAGVIPSSKLFLQQLRQLCDEKNLLLIFDEVQTGVGRLGAVFGYQLFDVAPDIITLGKGLGGGVPLAAVLARNRACVLERGEHGGTFNGSSLMTAVGAAVFKEVVHPDFLAHVSRMGAYLGDGLARLSDELSLGATDGIGLLRKLEIPGDDVDTIVNFARCGLKAVPGWEGVGVLLNAPRPHVLRFMPALNVSAVEIDFLLAALAASILETRANRQR